MTTYTRWWRALTRRAPRRIGSPTLHKPALSLRDERRCSRTAQGRTGGDSGSARRLSVSIADKYAVDYLRRAQAGHDDADIRAFR
jgi:hypothetical protein